MFCCKISCSWITTDPLVLTYLNFSELYFSKMDVHNDKESILKKADDIPLSKKELNNIRNEWKNAESDYLMWSQAAEPGMDTLILKFNRGDGNYGSFDVNDINKCEITIAGTSHMSSIADKLLLDKAVNYKLMSVLKEAIHSETRVRTLGQRLSEVLKMFKDRYGIFKDCVGQMKDWDEDKKFRVVYRYYQCGYDIPGDIFGE